MVAEVLAAVAASTRVRNQASARRALNLTCSRRWKLSGRGRAARSAVPRAPKSGGKHSTAAVNAWSKREVGCRETAVVVAAAAVVVVVVVVVAAAVVVAIRKTKKRASLSTRRRRRRRRKEKTRDMVISTRRCSFGRRTKLFPVFLFQ
jgi:hypothetical protein